MRLTRDEILLIALVLGGLLVGATVQHYRDVKRRTGSEISTPDATAKP